MTTTPQKPKRQYTGRGPGFASMDPEQQKAIASKGGKIAQARGTAYRWTPEKAQEAGRIGGRHRKPRRREELT